MKGTGRFMVFFFLVDIQFHVMSIVCCRGPVSRSQWPRRPLCGSATALLLDCGLQSRRGHGRLSVVSVVCCQVEVCDDPIPHPEVSYRVWYV